MSNSVKKVEGITKEATQSMIDEALEAYPDKARHKRTPHLAPNDPGASSSCVNSNRKTVPGGMRARGCADAGAKGDVWSAKALLEEIGLNVKATWTGDGEMERIAATHEVKLNLIHCYRSMNYMCKVMEEKYGIPWLEFNFFGPTKIRES